MDKELFPGDMKSRLIEGRYSFYIVDSEVEALEKITKADLDLYTTPIDNIGFCDYGLECIFEDKQHYRTYAHLIDYELNSDKKLLRIEKYNEDMSLRLEGHFLDCHISRYFSEEDKLK